MHIIWHGQSCFEIIASQQKGEQVKIIIDPFSEDIGLKLPKLEADILLTTHEHHDHNDAKAIGGPATGSGQATPFLIEGPGEYERKDIFIQGISSFHDEKNGAERGMNTIYTLEAEEMRLCHLGDFGEKELSPEQLEKIGDIDILMAPVGGTYTIDAKGAAKIISQIEPRIVIPMHYRLPKLSVKIDELEPFLKEMGRKLAEPQEKLLIKKKDLIAEETKIVVLQP